MTVGRRLGLAPSVRLWVARALYVALVLGAMGLDDAPRVYRLAVSLLALAVVVYSYRLSDAMGPPVNSYPGRPSKDPDDYR